MPVCVPVKDMKDTAAFARTVESAPGPVTVTRNGYDAFVVMRTDDYEAMQQELAKGRLLPAWRRPSANTPKGATKTRPRSSTR